MQIFINRHDCPELIYSVTVLFGVFLGLEFKIEKWDKVDTTIFLSNGKRLVLEDSFFKRFGGEYSNSLLPSHAESLESRFGTFTTLYGRNDVSVKDDSIVLSGDVLASTFFMLSRWEETLLVRKNQHQRICSADTFAGKAGLLESPIVNEYVEVLWRCLLYLDVKQERRQRVYTLVPTHDVDIPKLWWSGFDTIRSLGGSILKRKSLSDFLHLGMLKYKQVLSGRDPFDTFETLMAMSEQKGVKSHFFFMSGGKSKYDNCYPLDHPFIVELFEIIKKGGHHIGLHPSYDAYNDDSLFKQEKAKLEVAANTVVSTGRQHYLRFSNPETWQIWNQNDMHWDSTLSYADSPGFRCGVCYPFPVFNIRKRLMLTLEERSLIVMDGSLVTYQKFTPEQAISTVRKLKGEVKKYNGDFVFLWHNSAFATRQWRPYEPLLQELYS